MAPLAQVRSKLVTYIREATTHSELKAVLELLINSDRQQTPETFLTILREHLSVETIYSHTNLRGPATLFCVLRYYSVLQCLQYVPHPQSRQIYYGLVSSFFQTQEEKDILLQLLYSVKEGTTDNSYNARSQGRNHIVDDDEDRKLAHSVTQPLLKEGRLIGKLGKDGNEYVSDYIDDSSANISRNSRSSGIFTTFLKKRRRVSIAST